MNNKPLKDKELDIKKELSKSELSEVDFSDQESSAAFGTNNCCNSKIDEVE